MPRAAALLVAALPAGALPVGALLAGVLLVGAPGAAAAREEAGSPWSWPVPAPHPVLAGFEAPTEVWSPGHRGIDVGAAIGAVVLAPESGVVHYAGVVVDRPVLSIEHPGGVLSSFEPVAATVARGDSVQRGQPVGVVEAGHCADAIPCVHVGARVDGAYVSPLVFLGGVPRAVLLPTRPLAGAETGPSTRTRGRPARRSVATRKPKKDFGLELRAPRGRPG